MPACRDSGPCNLSVYIAKCSRLNLKLEEAFRPPLHFQSYLPDLCRRHPLLSPINSAYIWRSLDEVHTRFRVFRVLLVNPAVSQTLQKPIQTRSHSDKYTSAKYVWATRAYGKSTIHITSTYPLHCDGEISGYRSSGWDPLLHA